MDQGRAQINGPHQGAWVELESGESWFIHFQDRDGYGRITHLQPMRWVDDWPVIGRDPMTTAKANPYSGTANRTSELTTRSRSRRRVTNSILPNLDSNGNGLPTSRMNGARLPCGPVGCDFLPFQNPPARRTSWVFQM